MKKLEVNQMENLQGGSSDCFMAMYAYCDALHAYNENPDDPWNFINVGITFADMTSKCNEP